MSTPTCGWVHHDFGYEPARGRAHWADYWARSTVTRRELTASIRDTAPEDAEWIIVGRPIALQFIDDNSIAMLELAVRDEDDILRLNIVEEKQYTLAPHTDLSQ